MKPFTQKAAKKNACSTRCSWQCQDKDSPQSRRERRGENMKELTEKIIGAAIEVHKALGPGLLESSYEECLSHELKLRSVPFEKQVPLPVEYKGVKLDCGYRLDMLVNKKVVVELKAVGRLERIHEAQLLTYLKLGGWTVGLLINFNVPILKSGIKRIVLDYTEPSALSAALR